MRKYRPLIFESVDWTLVGLASLLVFAATAVLAVAHASTATASVALAGAVTALAVAVLARPVRVSPRIKQSSPAAATVERPDDVETDQELDELRHSLQSNFAAVQENFRVSADNLSRALAAINGSMTTLAQRVEATEEALTAPDLGPGALSWAILEALKPSTSLTEALKSGRSVAPYVPKEILDPDSPIHAAITFGPGRLSAGELIAEKVRDDLILLKIKTPTWAAPYATRRRETRLERAARRRRELRVAKNRAIQRDQLLLEARARGLAEHGVIITGLHGWSGFEDPVLLGEVIAKLSSAPIDPTTTELRRNLVQLLYMRLASDLD